MHKAAETIFKNAARDLWLRQNFWTTTAAPEYFFDDPNDRELQRVLKVLNCLDGCEDVRPVLGHYAQESWREYALTAASFFTGLADSGPGAGSRSVQCPLPGLCRVCSEHQRRSVLPDAAVGHRDAVDVLDDVAGD